jgi:hypothetical protein
MRYLFGFLSVCVLGVVSLVGCSETTGNGGSGGIGGGGSGGSGGIGGAGGTGYIPGIDDGNECTEYRCTPTDDWFVCSDPIPVADGTACAGGTCQSGVCELTGTTLPCTEQGVRNAIAAGGGPYTFACDGPTALAATFKIDNDVILTGEGQLIVDSFDVAGG